MSGETVQDKFDDTYFRVLDDPNISGDLKLFCITQLLHGEVISLHKAWELINENGIVSQSYLQLDDRLSKIWSRYYAITN